MPRKSPYPIPRKRYHGSRWQIYWKWDSKQYSIKTDYYDEDKTALIISDLRKISAALAENTPSFPERYAQEPAVLNYIAARYPAEKPADIPDSETILANYDKKNSAECGEVWAKNCRLRLNSLADMAGGILNVTPAIASEFLTNLLAAGRSTATRNRALAACTKFFKEMVRLGYIKDSPFTGIKQLKEAREEIIVYCTIDERARVLAAAESLGRADWIAVPIALYAGCRREEIFRLRWEDINFTTKRLIVRKSKTGKQRMTPIARELVEILIKCKQDRGTVVPSLADETWQNQADRLIEDIRDILCRPETPNLLGKASEAAGKKRHIKKEEEIALSVKATAKRIKELTPQVIASDKAKLDSKKLAIELACLERIMGNAHDNQSWIPAERIGWNAFRHTFATLRAQAGVSLDKISNWMGNTYLVCKTHYAQFMPRDSHDEDIDK